MRKNFRDELSKRVKAQLTTTKRTGINLAQQFRWHNYFDSELDFLRAMNTGLSACGKTFGELIDHFILGGDETGMIANDGKAEIVGDKDRKKVRMVWSDVLYVMYVMPTLVLYYILILYICCI